MNREEHEGLHQSTIYLLSHYININGQIVAATAAMVPCDSRTFRYGYGLFETILVRNGVMPLGKGHWNRLFAGMQQLGLKIPPLWRPEQMEAEVMRTVRKNKLEPLCRVRLQVFDGPGGLFDAVQEAPRFVIECFHLDDAATRLNINGLVTGIAPDWMKSKDSLSPLKSCNALIYVMAARYARQQRWNDSLILNTDHHIIESSIANIFWVEKDVVYTPPISEGCVAGVMRGHVMNLLPQHKIPIYEALLTAERLKGADEIFLTNSIRKIKWVRSVGDQNYSLQLAPLISEWLNNI